MTITKEELQRTYSRKSIPELLAILGDEGSYTPLAIEVAREQVQARGLYDGEIQEHYSDLLLRKDEAYRREHFVDLRSHEKVFCYLAGPILLGLLNMYLFLRPYLGKPDEETLRFKRTLLFAWSGFAGLILAFMLEHVLGTIAGIAGWLAWSVAVFWWDRKAVARRKAAYEQIYGPASGEAGQALAKG